MPDNENNPLIIIDSLPEVKASMFDLDLLNNKISSFIVLKGKEATDKYGDKGKNGVIEIKTIGKTSDKTASEMGEKLIMVDGVVYTKNINDIPMENIDVLRVLGKFESIRKYGEQGKNGVVEIVTKKQKKDQL